MIRRIAIGVVALWMLWTAALLPLAVSANYELPEDKKKTLTADAALVMYLGTDMSRDMIMFEQNADKRMTPGGMVRVMVGMYALKVIEEYNIDTAVATGTYTEEVFDLIAGQDIATVGMQYGDVWHVDDLLTIGVIRTAADAVGTLSVTLAGSHERFVEGMNALAAEIGCADTHFTNVFGLDHAEQYTTARDMYKILRYATLHYPQMIDILSLKEHTTAPVLGEAETWITANEMLRESSEYFYSPLVYGRTGNSETGGHASASVARDSGFEFMTVVMGCKDDDETTEGLAFRDTKTLFRWVYNSFSYRTLVRKGQPITRIGVDLAWSVDSTALVAGDDLEGMLRSDVDLGTLRYEVVLNEEIQNRGGRVEAPLEEGQVCGEARVYDGEDPVGTVSLVVGESVERSQVLAVLSAVWGVVTNPFVLTVLGVMAALFIGYVVMTVSHNKKRRRQKRRPVKRYK